MQLAALGAVLSTVTAATSVPKRPVIIVDASGSPVCGHSNIVLKALIHAPLVRCSTTVVPRARDGDRPQGQDWGPELGPDGQCGRVTALKIDYYKGATRRYRSVLHRADGVDIELDSSSCNKIGGAAGEVPHDIAHLVVEEELGLERGVWGVLAAGGLFRGASVVAGRQRPRRRAARPRDPAGVGRAAQPGRGAHPGGLRPLADRDRPTRPRCAPPLGPRWWWDTATEDALARAFERLGEAGERWARLRAGEALRCAWGGRWTRGRVTAG